MNWRMLTDCVWPTLEPEAPEYKAKREAHVLETVAARVAACTKKPDPSREWLEHERQEYEAEGRRGEQARTFHQAMLATGGVAVAATLGLLVWFEPAKVTGVTATSALLFRLLGIYLLVQLAGVLRAAVDGVRVREYQPMPHPISSHGESGEAFNRRKAGAIARATAFNTDQNDERVSAKRLVVRCWQNFCAGLLVVALSAGIALINNSF